MRKIVSIVSALVLFQSCSNRQEKKQFLPDEIRVVVKRNYTPRPAGETVSVVLDWAEVTGRLPQAEDRGFTVTDTHFDKALESRLVDTDGDEKADKIAVTYPFVSNEPQYTLMIKPAAGKKAVEAAEAVADDRLEITYLKTYEAYFSDKDSVTDWPTEMVETSLNLYPDPADFTIISPEVWTYEHGLYLSAVFELWQRTKNEKYFNYIKDWTDLFLTDEGRIREDKYKVEKYRLDDILPGRLCIFLYEETGDEKYRVAADQLKDHLMNQPKTSEGGYWHKEIYPYQMWLDGIYMADIFSTQYAKAFNDPHLFDEAALQIKLIAAHTKDPATGLFYHGWDESKNKVWADSVTGTSPSFWGRAIGWYFMALVECLDNLPQDHQDRAAIETLFKDLAKSLTAYQDEETGLWYQVIDKGGRPGNWIETSCSAMFAYGFAKGYNKGLLDESYRTRAQSAFGSIIKDYSYYDDGGNFYLAQTVKVGTLNPKVSKGDYRYYITSECRINDYKGLAPLLYTAMALSQSPNI